jgi:plasmid stabilization system protein ParE
MRPSSTTAIAAQNIQPRWADLELDLGISDPQRSAWQTFAETFIAAMTLLRDLDHKAAQQFAERPPSFPGCLELELSRLTAHIDASRMLQAVSRSLYCLFTPRQRERADRLLARLCGQLVGHPRSGSFSQPTPARSPAICEVPGRATIAAELTDLEFEFAPSPPPKSPPRDASSMREPA